MKDICKIFTLGTITQAPTIKKSAKGDFMTFSIAVHDVAKNGNDWEEITNFFNITSWQTKIFDYLEVGKKVAITGDLNFEKYKSKNGEDRTSIKIKATDIELAITKKQQEEEKGERKAEAPKKKEKATTNPDNFDEGEIPF